MEKIIDWIIESATLNGDERILLSCMAVITIIAAVVVIVALAKTLEFPEINENDD